MSVIHQPREPKLDVRQAILPASLLALLAMLLFRLWFFQVVQADELQLRAEESRVKTVDKPAPRGLIYDRKGRILAAVRPEFIVTAVPNEMKKHPEVLAKLAGLLGAPTEALQENLDKFSWRPHLPAPIYLGVPVETATTIAESEFELPGVGIESMPMRYYPDTTSFAHILGYVGTPNEKDVKRLSAAGLKAMGYVGKLGIEYFYETELMGKYGGEKVEVDARGRPLRVVGHDSPQPGETLTLGLDADLQKQAIELLGNRPGAAVAIDPKSGEVLCLVSSPTYDAGLFEHGISTQDWKALQSDPSKPMVNRATHGAYAPGSTFKIVTTIAAYRTGKFDANRRVYCNGTYTVGNRVFKCLGKHGSISYNDALTHSCNVYFYDLADRVGVDAMREAAKEVGLDQRTGIDLLGEEDGIVPTEAWFKKWRPGMNWYRGDTMNMGIGQGYLAVTPIQMACLMALVANDGVGYRPHLARVFRPADPKAPIVKIAPVEAHHVAASARFWSILKAALQSVVDRGTAGRGRVPGIAMGGKTGSAENNKKETHSWFVGFAPVNDPKIAIAVVVENAGHGGDVAAPIAGKIVETYLRPRAADSSSIESPKALTNPAVPSAAAKSPTSR